MNARLLVRLLKAPKPLPPPDPNCRQYEVGEVPLLLRNHEQSKRHSQQFHQPRKQQ